MIAPVLFVCFCLFLQKNIIIFGHTNEQNHAIITMQRDLQDRDHQMFVAPCHATEI